jgi:hypothetical protein
VVCCEDKPRTTSDGIEIIPAVKFPQVLWKGTVFQQLDAPDNKH